MDNAAYRFDMKRTAILLALVLWLGPACALVYDFDYSAEMGDAGADAADATSEADGHGHGRP